MSSGMLLSGCVLTTIDKVISLTTDLEEEWIQPTGPACYTKLTSTFG